MTIYQKRDIKDAVISLLFLIVLLSLLLFV